VESQTQLQTLIMSSIDSIIDSDAKVSASDIDSFLRTSENACSESATFGDHDFPSYHHHQG